MRAGIECKISLAKKLPITLSAQAEPFTVEWTVAGDATARTVTLPLVDTRTEGALAYDCVVDWGDGTANSLVTAYNDANRIHTYASNGSYEMKVYGTMEGWSFNNGGDKDKLTKVLHWGDSSLFDGFKYLYGGFYGCSNLTDIGNSAIPASGTGILSDGFSYTFRSCSSLTSIPSNLFSNHTLAEDFIYTFGFSGLTSIPSGLFDGNTTADTFNYTFRSCPITSIPTGLFDNNTAATTFTQTFYGCNSISSIPTGLFDNNTLVNTFNSCFYGCSSITSIPSGLFDNNTAVTTFANTFHSTGITSIPTGLFDNNTLVTDFSYIFYSTDVSSIPSGLFDNNTLVTTFSNAFRGTDITSISSGLFDNNTLVENFSYTFTNSRITSIPSGLFDSNTAVTTFANCFATCSYLETTPSELFRFNTACINFSYVFRECYKHQQNVDLFYQAGEQATRFLNQSVNFTNCFDRSSFSGTQGTAPDLWNCSFGTGTPTTTDCWNGAGNSAASLTNYASIPGAWL